MLLLESPGVGRRIRFDVLHDCETCPLEAHFQSREQPVVTRQRDPERTECFSRLGIAAQIAMCGSVLYRDPETTVPDNCRAASSELHCTASAELVIK
jgi:hypothetical protein